MIFWNGCWVSSFPGRWKTRKNTFSQIVVQLAMNPMVEAVKNHQANKYQIQEMLPNLKMCRSKPLKTSLRSSLALSSCLHLLHDTKFYLVFLLGICLALGHSLFHRHSELASTTSSACVMPTAQTGDSAASVLCPSSLGKTVGSPRTTLEHAIPALALSNY